MTQAYRFHRVSGEFVGFPDVEPDEYKDVSIKLDLKAAVVTGIRIEPQPNESRYVSFLAYPDHDDYLDRRYQIHGDESGLSVPQRLMNHIFGSEMIEPELPTEVVVLDGVPVVRVDLEKWRPGWVLVVPERIFL